jgi:hypothetical protein
LPLRDSTHSPLMKFLKTLGITAVAMRIPPWASWYVPLIDWDEDSMMQRSSETQSSKGSRRRQRTAVEGLIQRRDAESAEVGRVRRNEEPDPSTAAQRRFQDKKVGA